ncbi:MAG: MFS transporter [Antricoccus sp.]
MSASNRADLGQQPERSAVGRERQLPITHRSPQLADSRSGLAPGNTRRLAGLTWAHLLNDGASNYLPGVLPAVLVSLDQPVRLAGVLVAALTIGQALQPVTGWIADRLGGRALVIGGLTMTSVGGGLLGIAHSTSLLVVLLLLIGIGNAFFHPQALAGVRSMLQGKHGLLTSAFLVGGELGRGIWPTAASLVVSNLGLPYLWIVGIPGVLTVPLLARLAPKLPAAAKKHGSPIRWAEHARPMAVLVTYCSVRAVTTYALVTFIPILARTRGESLVSGASIITTMLIVGVIGNLWGGHLSDQLGRRPVLITSAIAAGVLVFPVVYSHGALVWITAAILGIPLFLTASTTVLIGQDIFPENRSMGSGVALGLANGIGALLVLIIGLWVDQSNVLPVFWIVGGLSIASAGLVLTFPRHLVPAPSEMPPA